MPGATALLEETVSCVNEVGDVVGNLNSEVAGSEIETEVVCGVGAELVGVEQPIIVGLRVNAADLDSFCRNGWEVTELDATYDADDQVEPVFEELSAEESRVGLDVRTFRDARGNTHVMTQRECPMMNNVLADMGWEQWREKLRGASFAERAGLWERLQGEMRWRLLQH